jgi:hypothetical protein
MNICILGRINEKPGRIIVSLGRITVNLGRKDLISGRIMPAAHFGPVF